VIISILRQSRSAQLAHCHCKALCRFKPSNFARLAVFTCRARPSCPKRRRMLRSDARLQSDRAEGGDEPDLLAALADGLAAAAPPPRSAPDTTAVPAAAQATSRASRQNATVATGRLPAPSTAGAGRVRFGMHAPYLHVRHDPCYGAALWQYAPQLYAPSCTRVLTLTQSGVWMSTGPATFGRHAESSHAGPASACARGLRPDSATEPLSGLRVKNPKFPAIVLAERLANLCFVKVGQLRWLSIPHLAMDWDVVDFARQGQGATHHLSCVSQECALHLPARLVGHETDINLLRPSSRLYSGDVTCIPCLTSPQRSAAQAANRRSINSSADECVQAQLTGEVAGRALGDGRGAGGEAAAAAELRWQVLFPVAAVRPHHRGPPGAAASAPCCSVLRHAVAVTLLATLTTWHVVCRCQATQHVCILRR